MKEYVYILSNASMPGIIKIGRASRDIEDRVKELNSATDVPTPFVVERIFSTSNSNTLEHLIHEELSLYRVADNRELFQLTPEEAINHISSIYLEYEQSEETVLLHLRQGKWEYENIPSNEWSEKGRHYSEQLDSRKEQEYIEKENLQCICGSIIHEVDKYPEDLWSPETKDLIENIKVGRISEIEQTYLDMLERCKSVQTKEQEIIDRRKRLFEMFGYQYVIDENRKEVSPFSIKHPNFYEVLKNRRFVRRLKEL